ncbi:MAG: nitroreductase family protein [Dissulfurispiraceae bacterium]|nr:nitroreductase family protein [Dissulfurispiraceae bacterium]
MDAITAILTRRSIRKYTLESVSESVIKELLQCAMSAPSAGNQQPWHFIILTDRGVLNSVADFHPHAQMLREGPLAILVCADTELEKYKDYWVQDCSASTQNLLLAAHAKGLGAVWLGIYPRMDRMDAIRRLMSLPPSVMPLSLISLGYPAESKEPSERFSLSRIHYDSW